MPNTKKIFNSILFLLTAVFLYSCNKKEEPQTFIPPDQENTVDKEKEKKEREEFERLKNLKDGKIDSVTGLVDSMKVLQDSSINKADSSKTGSNDKKKLVQKEKELNKRLDNPKTAIDDYLEFLKRGTSEGGNFDQNMKKASELWVTPNANRFKSNYKNTQKIIILEEPKVTSQSGSNAVVEVKIKKIDKKNDKSEELEMVVKYNLVADSRGKWKIKDNAVVKK